MQAYERRRTRDKLECGCKVNAQDTSTRLCWHERHERESGTSRNVGIKSPEQWRNQWREDKQGVEDAGTEEESKGCKEDTRDNSRKQRDNLRTR